MSKKGDVFSPDRDGYSPSIFGLIWMDHCIGHIDDRQNGAGRLKVKRLVVGCE